MRRITVILAVVLSFMAFAPVAAQKISNVNVCKQNILQHDICEEVIRIQRELAPQLPQKIQKNLTIRSVIADKNSLVMVAMLTYDRDFLENAVLQGNRTMADVAIQMQAMTKKIACSLPATEALIGLGGAVEYVYTFINGEAYLDIRVDEC